MGCGWSGPGESLKTLFLYVAFLGAVITSLHYLFYISLLKSMLLAGDVSLFCTS